ncbi:hypothetical protein PHMEG_00016735 [Phytophthora megakarya]|uniref:Reverse transcriptase RNase H-like domain-containing protein n=1 Tax=Phytophthora megakarya TaxID=4795 RepID=A0A225W041_9STRA|nr:hypothetical protein PHMEG_00016735 [Phytophthora megakarya]
MLFANECALSTTLLLMYDERLHSERFCERVLKEKMNYYLAEKEVLALLLLLKTFDTQLAGRTLWVYTSFSTLEWLTKSKSLLGRAVGSVVVSMALDGSARQRKHRRNTSSNGTTIKRLRNGPNRLCTIIAQRLPSWEIVIAANAHLESTTVNVAEYYGLNNGVEAALVLGAKELMIFGDSRLGIHQSPGVIACRNEALMV